MPTACTSLSSFVTISGETVVHARLGDVERTRGLAVATELVSLPVVNEISAPIEIVSADMMIIARTSD